MIEVYEVGGSIRDRVLGMMSNDRDFAVEAPSYEAMKEFLLGKGMKIWQERPEYSTIRGQIKWFDPKPIDADFVLCRRDGFYSDGRRPDEVFLGDIYDDLARRDFTMNAMALDMHGNLIDPYNGTKDIADGVIRCVGSTSDRMSEDGLRMIRAIRFSITKHMQISYEIRRFLKNSKNIVYLENVSDERIYEEMKKCFTYSTLKTLRLLELYPEIRDYVFGSHQANHVLWLLPTMEKR